MKVILKEYVYLHGVAGDIVDVKDGFARNFLIPQGKAVKATEEAIKRNEALLAEAAIRRQELNDQLMAVSNKIDGTVLVFGRKAERNNKLYGSVTTMDIAEALLAETGIDINRRRISERSLRELGEFEIPIRMGHELAPVVKVVILREDEVDEYLAKLEAGEIDVDEIGVKHEEDAEATEEGVEAIAEEVVAEVEGEAVEESVEEPADA